jgi:multicomponent Na+:H+ antiporter subunit G
MISVVLDVIGAALLLVGLMLITIGLYGVLRLPDTLSQLHAQGLATEPGALAVLASSVATENAAIITFAVLAIALVTLTSSVLDMPSRGPPAIATTADRWAAAGRWVRRARRLAGVIPYCRSCPWSSGTRPTSGVGSRSADGRASRASRTPPMKMS